MKLLEKKIEENNVIITIKMSEYAFCEKFVVCADCGGLIFRDEALKYGEKYYCENCVTTCSHCGEEIPLNAVYNVEESTDVYCHDCYIENTYVCHDCRRHFRYEDSLLYSEEEECDYCPDCYDSHENKLIRCYHTFKDTGNYVFLGNEKRNEAPYAGFELEIDTDKCVDREEIAEHIETIMPEDYFHFENDGSLSEDGFEMISQPCSLTYNLALRNKFSELFSYLSQMGMRSHDIGTCG